MVFSATGGAPLLSPRMLLPGVWNSALGTTGVDELERLTVLKGTLHHQITSDGVVLETLEHLTAKKLEIQGTGITRKVSLTQLSKLSGVNRRLKSHFF
jgi:hypothetical protein